LAGLLDIPKIEQDGGEEAIGGGFVFAIASHH
jgi:hypothetical protein